MTRDLSTSGLGCRAVIAALAALKGQRDGGQPQSQLPSSHAMQVQRPVRHGGAPRPIWQNPQEARRG